VIIDDAHTRTLLAVCHQTHPTCRSVAAETGVSASCAYYRLSTLRDAGLVAWEDGKDGTMRSLVAEVLPVAPVIA
jgi:DNA-binding IscR family transcriptional regulator